MRDLLAICGGYSLLPALPGAQHVRSAAALASLLEKGPPRAVIVELVAPAPDRLQLIRAVRGRYPAVPCVVVARNSTEEMAVAALRAGANEYLRAPVETGAILAVLDRLCRPPDSKSDCGIIGDHPAARRVAVYLDRVSATDSTVLITGETGTGKELAARRIHTSGRRRDQPFVSVNCAAVPDTLLESELFGRERGAYTGAYASADGKFRQADRGTLFLDEIGDMTAFAQAKLLRVLETREVWRLGGSRGIPVDVRIIAATNQNIEELVAAGRFRPDLFYRLNVARLRMPALRERRSDIPLLVAHYVRQMNLRFGREIAGFSEESMERMTAYDWPGNIRELKNFVEAAFIDLPLGRSGLAELPDSLLDRLRGAVHQSPQEQEQLLNTLKEMRWNVSRAAERLHISRMTLYRKIAKYGIARG
jgi:DNA-binding NtrC family response regulator